MGHALNNTLQDILCRFERMRGRDVLWQPGTDHAGIATQMVVERQLMERQQPGRRDLGRAKFLERVWQWKAESGGVIVNQLKRLGASCDWSRERFTMDEGLSRAVVKVFVELHREGLIYKDKRLVNWTEAVDGYSISRCSRSRSRAVSGICVIRWKGKSSIPTIPRLSSWSRPRGRKRCSATPQSRCIRTNERYTRLVGKHAILPLVGRRIPILADEYSDPEKRLGRGQGDAGARFQRFRGRPPAQSAADQRARSGGRARARGQRRLPARIAGRLIAACRRVARPRPFRRAQRIVGAAGRFRLHGEGRTEHATWFLTAIAPASSSSPI